MYNVSPISKDIYVYISWVLPLSAIHVPKHNKEGKKEKDGRFLGVVVRVGKN